MKEIKESDLIKSAKYIGSDLVSEAMDYVPVQYKRTNPAVYIGSAACAALVIASIPVIAKYRLQSTPGYSESTPGSQTLSDTNDSSGTNAELNASGSFKIPLVANTKLPADTPRTFYDINGIIHALDSRTDYGELAESGKIVRTLPLEQFLSGEHDSEDLFAVRVYEYTGASAQMIDKEFAYKYDLDSEFISHNIIFMTEKQIQDLEAPSDLAIVLDIASRNSRGGIEVTADSEYLETVRSDKVYAAVTLKRGENYAPPEEQQNGHRVVTAEGAAAMRSYMDGFAEEFGIDYEQLFAGNIRYEDAEFSGELTVKTVEKLISDDRVASVVISDGSSRKFAGYVYESHSYQEHALKVTKSQMEKLPAGLTYYEIEQMLGKTAVCGNSKTLYYVTDNADLIILKFESKNDVCPLSGKELYDSAVPLYYSGEFPETADSDMTCGVFENTFIVTLDSDGYTDYDWGRESPDGCEIIHEDGTPATYDELVQSGGRVFFKAERQTEVFPTYYECSKIVILDD